ncbi:hypothetical protein MMEU_1022 [Mycobacterium marinum str. Europe]|nr:hypothetical protein MMEU_1022 [Mycobacterium marinum str. Europe]
MQGRSTYADRSSNLVLGCGRPLAEAFCRLPEYPITVY